MNVEDLKMVEIRGWHVLTELDNFEEEKWKLSFSQYFRVQKERSFAVLKIFDAVKCIQEILKIDPDNAIQKTQEELAIFKYEQEIGEYCKERHVANLTRCVESGWFEANGQKVHFVIYEEHDKNLAEILNYSRKLETLADLKNLSQKLMSLHDVATALNQLHLNGIAYQNVLP